MSASYFLRESYNNLISSVVDHLLANSFFHPYIVPDYSPFNKQSLFYTTSYYPYIIPSDLKNFLEHYLSQLISKSVQLIDNSSSNYFIKINTERYVDESNIVRRGNDNVVFLYGGKKQRMKITQIHKIYFFGSVDGNTCYFPLFKSNSLIQEFYNGIIRAIFKMDALSLNEKVELGYSKTIAVGDFWKVHLGFRYPKDEVYEYLRGECEAILYEKSWSSDEGEVKTQEIMYFLDENTLNYSHLLILPFNTLFYLNTLRMQDPKESKMYPILKKVIKRFFYKEHNGNNVVNLSNLRKLYRNV